MLSIDKPEESFGGIVRGHDIFYSSISLYGCSFYYGCIANLRNHILNIDHLEMKHAYFSGGSIV